MSVREMSGPRYRARQNVAMAAILRANQVPAAPLFFTSVSDQDPRVFYLGSGL